MADLTPATTPQLTAVFSHLVPLQVFQRVSMYLEMVEHHVMGSCCDCSSCWYPNACCTLHTAVPGGFGGSEFPALLGVMLKYPGFLAPAMWDVNNGCYKMLLCFPCLYLSIYFQQKMKIFCVEILSCLIYFLILNILMPFKIEWPGTECESEEKSCQFVVLWLGCVGMCPTGFVYGPCPVGSVLSTSLGWKCLLFCTDSEWIDPTFIYAPSNVKDAVLQS